MTIQMLQGDCRDLMRGLPDKAFDLAIVDPPYGWGNLKLATARVQTFAPNSGGARSMSEMDTSWNEAPGPEYFSELMRVSKNQVIWGGNYFQLPPTKGIVCWDKQTGHPNMAKWEMAWTSFDSPADIFACNERGFMAIEPSIHPTQKPVALYKWLLTRYAKPGWKILDTHGGSGSDCVALHDVNADLVARDLDPMSMLWIEKDPYYYAAAVARYKIHAAQLHLFSPEETRQPEPQELF